jgi:hypothetical protein
MTIGQEETLADFRKPARLFAICAGCWISLGSEFYIPFGISFFLKAVNVFEQGLSLRVKAYRVTTS